jgi:CDP-paratose 2-epimerase
MPPSPLRSMERPFGFAEWFRVGEYDRARTAIKGIRDVGATFLRTHLSWAEYHAPGGQAWFDWLIPALAESFDVLPCVHYTPPSLSRTGRTSGPPHVLKDYADFVDIVLSRYGDHFTYVELWNEPNNLLDWDWRQDPDWLLFSEMVGGAAYWIQHRGWKAVLGGPSPFDQNWLDLMGKRGVLNVVSAVGCHGFPGTWDSEVEVWRGWDAHLGEMRAVLDRYNPAAETWITEAGYSTWRHDEANQVDRFRSAIAAPASRVYWYGWQDIPRDVAVQEGVYFDPRHYALGVTDAEGHPKLLRRLLETATATSVELRSVRKAAPVSPILVIGGAGFIGSNLAASFAAEGQDVVLFDSLRRPGVEQNLAWLQRTHPAHITACFGDIRDQAALDETVAGAKAVFHFASQVAVTTSLADPAHDFAINALGTLQVLEAVRRHAPTTPVIFASTNKVYGDLADIPLSLWDDRHLPSDAVLRRFGIDETRPLDFCTPYGCSKGSADQYVLDYAKSYGLRTAVLRMSCIYGPRQFGTEDQGWVAHFLIRALRGEAITLYGDGHQVRDVLHVNDAVAAYRAVLAAIDEVSGKAFNLGGGPDNAVSLAQVLEEIGNLGVPEMKLLREDWRTGDQLYFVADTRRLAQAVGWNARIGWRDGLRNLANWLGSELELPNARPAAITRLTA